MLKNPKYKSGDILKYTNPINGESGIVILTIRWDKPNSGRIAWKYKVYPNGSVEYAAPEEEFSIIN
jgi:hypothetical protein